MTLILTKIAIYLLTSSITLGIGLLKPESVNVDKCLKTVFTKSKNQKKPKVTRSNQY